MLLYTVLSLLFCSAPLLTPAFASKRCAKPSSHTNLLKRAESNSPDHPDWFYLNGIPWWKHDPTQQDHMRLHSYLSMAAYGDYASLCPNTFTQGFTVMDTFNAGGQEGYIASVPQMNKVVVVFKGNGDYDYDQTPVSIDDLVTRCNGCTAAAGIVELYKAAKVATNDFAAAKTAVQETGLLFSVTGHGVGGCVAALAALDLGSRNLAHFSHNQGTPRCFNYEAVVLYDDIFQVLAGQSLVAGNDNVVQLVPEGTYYHLGQKAYLTGDRTQWLTNCWGNNENTTCLGDGSSESDHKYYFTPLGQCGSADKGF